MTRPGPVPIPGCPDADSWIRFAARRCTANEEAALLEHAAGCGACADRLRDLLDASADDDDPAGVAEDEAIAALADRLEQRKAPLAAAMARSNRAFRPRRQWILAVAAALLLAAAGTWFAWNRAGSRPPLNMLAEAYAAHRTLELQIPGAAYAPLRVSRSSAGLQDEPPALLQSELAIQRHLQSHPDDPAWLHARGRAELLEWQYDAALASFQAAADLGLNSPEFLIDYASAYYERAERSSVALDYARAIEKLGQALALRPSDATALFNRGVVRAKLHQYGPAIDDFEQSLSKQIDPQWRRETEARIAEAKRPLGLLFNPQSPPLSGEPAEQRLEDAMTSGLADFFHGDRSSIPVAAAALWREHQDPWLDEMVKLSPTPEVRAAVETLTAMARLRVTVNLDYADVEEPARRIASTPLPAPLRAWRDYEAVYRDARASATAGCARRADAVAVAAEPYPWLESQTLLETSACLAAAQDFNASSRAVDRAEALMRGKNLRLALLRVPNFRGQRLAETGYFREAFQTAADALAEFDIGGYPARRAYDFHGIAMLVANQLNLPYTGFGATRMMADIGEKNQLPLFDMVGHCRNAGFALSLGLNREATADLSAAESALHRMANSNAAKIYWRTSRAAWLESQNDATSLYSMLDDARREGPAGKQELYFNRKLIAALCRLEARAGRRARVEELAAGLWEEAEKSASPQTAGELRAFRPELESVSASLAAARLNQGDERGGFEAWKRFLAVDERLLGKTSDVAGAVFRPDAGATVVTAAVLDGRVAIWRQSGREMHFHWITSADALEGRIRRMRRLCSLGASMDKIETETRALFQLVFPDGVPDGSRVYIRARGFINLLPLAAFSLIPEGRMATFSFLLFEEQPEDVVWKTGAMQMTVVAATGFGASAGAPALPDAELEEELTAVRRAFPHTRVIQGTGATAKAVENAADTSDAIHFAGHATPWRSGAGLRIAPDPEGDSADAREGVWSMGRPRSLKAGLVVLSACSTGVGEDVATVEAGQLAASILLAGAREAVASLWDVDSTATAAWNFAFYRRLAEGKATAEAIKEASRELQSNPLYESPRYWAAFVLYQR